MTLTQLEYIVALDTYRHFATAADKCFVTQPTLSMQIQKLEEELTILLFDRSKHPIVPTAEGQAVIAQARTVLAEASRIKEIVKEQQQEVSGELRIGIIPTLAPYLLPLFLKKFIEKYPLVKLKIEEMTTEQIIHQLKNDLLDAGLLATPLQEAQILEKPLFYEAFVAYLSPLHPLAQKKELHPEDLSQEPMFLLGETHCFRLQVLQLCQLSPQKNTNLTFQAGSLETLKRMVDLYGGITLLPELALDSLSEEQLDNVRYFTSPSPLREVSLVQHRSYVKQKLLGLLAAEICGVIPPKMLAQTVTKKQIVPIKNRS
ncbi:MAG: hydrogen peroxide-inducible genes activator [Thermoflexibacteraceae bacterium]